MQLLRLGANSMMSLWDERSPRPKALTYMRRVLHWHAKRWAARDVQQVVAEGVGGGGGGGAGDAVWVEGEGEERGQGRDGGALWQQLVVFHLLLLARLLAAPTPRLREQARHLQQLRAPQTPAHSKLPEKGATNALPPVQMRKQGSDSPKPNAVGQARSCTSAQAQGKGIKTCGRGCRRRLLPMRRSCGGRAA